MREIVLINPYPGTSEGINEATIYPPIGLAYLASYARRNGSFNNIRIIDANVMRKNNQEVLRELLDNKPLVVGIHLNVILGRAGTELSRLIKKEIGCQVIIGGPLVSSNPEDMLKISEADVAVIGEGEETFLELLQQKPLEDILGIVYKVLGGRFKRNPPRPLINDLNSIPFPAYDLLPNFKMYKNRARKKPVGVILTSRGCPYQCTFCNASVFGKKFRARSPENVLKEIDLLVNHYGIKQLDVLDDNFTLDISRARAILEGVRHHGLCINLQNGIRADTIDAELVKLMKKAGVIKVGIGIESGDSEVLRSVKKNLDLDRVREAIRLFRKKGIITIGFFILGFPCETKESIEKTIKFSLEANPSIANFCLLIPFPGTEMHQELLINNQLKEPDRLFYDSGFYANRTYHACSGLTEKELLRYQKIAYKKFNFRLVKIIETMIHIRSLTELSWTITAALPLIKNILKREK
jgi:radical SAM superfamily enzyme YgiQ (UPF0313 family)